MALLEDVILNLVMRLKADPAEAQRMAAAGLGPLEQALRDSLVRQAAAHASAQKAMTDEQRAAAKTEIAESQAKTAQLAAAARVLGTAEQRAARDTTNTIRNERSAAKAAVEASYAAILQARRRLSSAENEEARKQAQEEVRTAEATSRSLVAQFDHLKNEHRAAMVGMQENWRAWLEVGENATTVLTGMFAVISGGYQRFKAFGEEVMRTTQIMQSNHVSIEAARVAIDGTASSLELITAANKAAQLDLNLTGEQFANVARQAKDFADSTGIDSVEALNSLITGISGGIPKMLKHAGVIIDTDKAYKTFAATLHASGKELSDEGKRVAIQEAAMSKLATMSATAAKEMKKPLDVSHQLEKSFATMKNSWDEFVFSIGNTNIDDGTFGVMKTAFEGIGSLISGAIHGLLVELPHALRVYTADVKDAYEDIKSAFGLMSRDDRHRYADQENAKYGAQLEAEEKARIAHAAAATGVAAAPPERNRSELLTPQPYKPHPLDTFDKAMQDVIRKAAADRDELASIERDINYLLEHPFEAVALASQQSGRVVASSQRASMSDAISFGLGSQDALPGKDGGRLDSRATISQMLSDRYANQNGMPEISTGAQRTDFAMNERNDAEVRNRQAAVFDTDIQKQASAQSDSDKQKELQDVEDKAAKVKEQFIALGGEVKTVGGIETKKSGLLSQLVFGEDGPQTVYDEMDEAQQELFDFTKKLSDGFAEVGSAASGAVGVSLAAALGENKNLKAALKDSTHAVLMSISEQAFVKAAWNTAEGLAALVTAPAAAPGFFAAAAAFTGVATLAGFGARATFTVPPATGAGATPSVSRNPVASSGSGGGGGGGNPSPVFITVHVNPGGEEAAGRALLKSLQSLKEQTGMDIAKALSI